MLKLIIDLKNNKKRFPFIYFFHTCRNDRLYIDFNDLLLFLRNCEVDSEVIAELVDRGGESYDSITKKREEDDKKIEKLEKEIK